MSDYVVIFHAGCTDGMAAAWALRRLFPTRFYGVPLENTTFTPMHYGDPLDVEALRGKSVHVLDFSFPRATLLALEEAADFLLVLDHHKTAQADLEGLPFCTFDMARSGAGLAWDAIAPSSMPRPPIIDYVEDRDLWRFKLPHAKAVGAALQELPVGVPGQPLDFEAWDRAAQMSVEQLAMMGTLHLLTQHRLAKVIARHAQPAILGGHACKVAVTAVLQSEVGELLTSEHPMGVTCFQREDGKWVYSLRSRSDFDVSEVARQFGGGGHAQAAGFTVDEPAHQAVRWSAADTEPLQVNALLLTRDGCKTGNAIVVRAEGDTYDVLTDYGNLSRKLTRAEVAALWRAGGLAAPDHKHFVESASP